ncbi:hypothetical protein ES703_62435 [subsurface metagenome]
MLKRGLNLLIVGVVIVILTYFYDLIVGKGEIILGPKSYSAMGLGAILIITGLVLMKRKK